MYLYLCVIYWKTIKELDAFWFVFIPLGSVEGRVDCNMVIGLFLEMVGLHFL